MSYRIGIVKSIEPGGYAQVLTERKTACGECGHNKLVCYGCLLSPNIVGRVANPAGAGIGDAVKVCLSNKKLFVAAGMFYILPVITLLTGALGGLFISQAFGMPEDGTAITCAFAGLLAGMLAVTVLGRTNTISKILEPAITTVVSRNELKGLPDETSTDQAAGQTG